jgi:hypothetical protein
MEYSEILQRRIRRGDYEANRHSTFEVFGEACDRQDAADAAALADYVVDECRIIYDIMRQWQGDLRAFLIERGVSEEEVAAIDCQIVAKLDEPDGTPHDPPRSWQRLLDLILEAQEGAWTGRWADAKAAMAAARDRWRIEHDRDADWSYGLMAAIVERFGEDAIPDMYRHIAGPLFHWRYAKFDTDRVDWDSEALPTLMYITLEAMRAHLCTRKRDGAPLELIEHDDRWEVRFDPCGSGGRIFRGDEVEGTPPRREPPYDWPLIESAHDWTDGKAGVCIYCNHCQVMMEHMPMDRYGYPIRVIEPPHRDGRRYDGSDGPQTCSWIMYKDPTTVPEEIYERCGRVKPDAFGSRSHEVPDDKVRPGWIGNG